MDTMRSMFNTLKTVLKPTISMIQYDKKGTMTDGLQFSGDELRCESAGVLMHDGNGNIVMFEDGKKQLQFPYGKCDGGFGTLEEITDAINANGPETPEACSSRELNEESNGFFNVNQLERNQFCTWTSTPHKWWGSMERESQSSMYIFSQNVSPCEVDRLSAHLKEKDGEFKRAELFAVDVADGKMSLKTTSGEDVTNVRKFFAKFVLTRPELHRLIKKVSPTRF